MAKRKNIWTENKIAKYIKEGRGLGELDKYKPWLTIQNVPSHGRVHRIKGWKTKRIHHLFSDLERDYFLLLDWSDNVLDIREQFPLIREETLKIAEEKGIKHSFDVSTDTPIVMTTDFFITVKRGNDIIHMARTLKMSKELNDSRTIEKFEIEREYWEKQNIDWGIVTELDIPREISKNVLWLHNDYFICNDKQEWLPLFKDEVNASQKLILEILREFDEKYSIEKGYGLSLFKHLIATKNMKIDMRKQIDLQNLQLGKELLLITTNEEKLA